MNRLRAAILRGARATPLPGGAVRGTRAGDGLVFSQLRGYVEGDDPRRIDHAATARVGALQTRVYLEETALLMAAIVDESASMRVGRARPLADAAYEALQTWFGALEGADRAARIVDERIVRDRRAAARVRAERPFAFAPALTLARHALPRNTALLAIVDGFDLPDDRLLMRAGLHFDATVLLARDPWRDEMPLRGFVRMRDAESGRVRRVFFGARERAAYVAAAHAREDALRTRFRAAGWRVGTLDERGGRLSLLHAFGVAA